MTEADFILKQGDNSIRFTPDGKVAIKDAVKLLSGSDHWLALWDRVLSEDPEIIQYCEMYSFQNETNQLVVDSKGWEKILFLLFKSISGADPQ